MTQTITINGHEIPRFVYNGEPVVTLTMVAMLHGQKYDLVHENFNRYKECFRQDKDYFFVPYEEWKELPTENRGYRGRMLFLTQLGYLRLARTLSDKPPWDICIEMTVLYFATRTLMESKYILN